MGTCLSYAAPSGAPEVISAPSAKVVMLSGALAEFSSPAITASLVLPPGCFLCDSDDLQIDHLPPAVSHDCALLAGHLYFVFPDRMRGVPLQGSFMAELAVTASAALLDAPALAELRNQKKWRQYRFCGALSSLTSSLPEKKKTKNNKLSVNLKASGLQEVTPSSATAEKKSKSSTPRRRLQRKGSMAKLVRRLSGRSRLTPIEEADE